MKQIPLETNPEVAKKIHINKTLSCGFCPPNKGENRGRNNQYCKKHKSWKFGTKKTKQSQK